jgi:hypothetical protein
VTPLELHRPVRIAHIGADGMEVLVEASEAECAALAARMRLPAIPALRARFMLARGVGGTIEAAGRLEATVVQTCVVSLEDFDAPVAEDFVVHFVPEGTESDDPDPESVDEIPYAGDSIDLGEATAEQLALSLDPYPRRPGALLPQDAADAVDARLAELAAWRGAKGGSGRNGPQ